ncbi:hypothetical protein RB195_025279 [Necator americanus]|uniref:Collagen triple helix repeat protein n=1 Tax=Necator americanus TaxID=51031 RepID=A0ABR1ERQ1_NECAM
MVAFGLRVAPYPPTRDAPGIHEVLWKAKNTKCLALITGNIKDNTDQSWNDLLHLQTVLFHPRRRRSGVSHNVLHKSRTLHKVKSRQSSLLESRLPSWCQCKPIQLQCPQGPRGPPGSRGSPGVLGENGPPGLDNLKSYPAFECPIRDVGCVRCPGGPTGFRGPPGKYGLKGPSGLPGIPGITKRASGPQGPVSGQGLPGVRGEPGNRGLPGRNGVIPVKKIGLPGAPGKHGQSGEPGKLGIRAQNGLPGAVPVLQDYQDTREDAEH